MSTINLEHTLDEWAAGWSTQDIERVLSLCTDQCLYEDVPLAVVNHGKEELRAFGQQVFNAFPDFKIELTTHIAAADWAMLEWTMSGTHQADLPGMPATGKHVEVRGASIVEFVGARIGRCSDYWDMATFLKQLGLMPAG